jgi:hypothetical protein
MSSLGNDHMDPGSGEHGVSRRSMLRASLAVAGFGALFGGLQAIGASPAAASGTGATAESAADGYRSATEHGFTNLTGIHAEYSASVASFPFPTPDGGDFPYRSSLRDPAPNALWERGNGAAEAYLAWQGLSVGAAASAASAGDTVQAAVLLDELEAAHLSPLRESFVEDSDGYFVAALKKARLGDFAELRSMTE